MKTEVAERRPIPVLVFCVLLGLAVGIPSTAQPAIPLQIGFYVESDATCADASNASLVLFTGETFLTSREVCELLDVRHDDERYEFTQVCTDIVHGETFSHDVVLTPHGARRFLIETALGRSRHRYCPQDELPEPWRDADLSDFQP